MSVFAFKKINRDSKGYAITVLSERLDLRVCRLLYGPGAATTNSVIMPRSSRDVNQ